MALIYFYDSTELDKQQLSLALSETDHHWEYVDDKISLDNLSHDTEVISIFVTSTVTREMIEAMPKLKLIACRSTGFNNVDFDAVKEKGITVVNVPTYGENTVAEYGFTMLLALLRKVEAVLDTENEQFSQADLSGHDIKGLTFGAIGTGHIGQHALKIANGFSMNVIAYDTKPNQEIADKLNFKYVELDELLHQADVISLHVPYLRATHHIINEERMAKMKPGAIIINTARGELVDTKALIDMLDKGHLGGAAIDVVEGENLLNHHEETALLRAHVLPEDVMRHSVEISVLKKMPNVIISPHNAFNTVEAIERINNSTAQNIIDFWYDKVPNKVEPPKKPVGKLLIARHAESTWNASGQWSGRRNVHLSEKGFKEASQLGHLLNKLEIELDQAYCSEQIRTRETLEGMLNTARYFDINIQTESALNERDYGDYTGKNKWEMKEILGEEKWFRIRRYWDEPIPNGESLKDVFNRVVPFYKNEIVPKLLKGDNILLVGHGNTIRALIKYLESITDENIANVEMIWGQIIVYSIAQDGLSLGSSVHEIDTNQPKH